MNLKVQRVLNFFNDRFMHLFDGEQPANPADPGECVGKRGGSAVFPDQFVESVHGLPFMLPKGKGFLFFYRTRGYFPGENTCGSFPPARG
jgi:hypothetical protein